MSVYFRAIIFLLPFLVFFPNDASAFSCTATFSDINFGQVSVRGTTRPRTIGNVVVSCTGAPSGNIQACIFIGSGSGGAATGDAPRYLRRTSGDILEYTLKSDFAAAKIWQNHGVVVTIGSDGTGKVSQDIHAEITSQGQNVKGGIYTSNFSGAGHVGLTYGRNTCEEFSSSPNSFSINAHIVPECSLTVGNLDFGNISATINNQIFAQANINVSCTANAPYTVTIGPGSGSGVTDPAARKMSSGANTLVYGLYQNSGTTVPWGWSPDINGYKGTGTGNNQTLTVYGRINSGQTANLGTYTDSVVVTVTY